MTEHDPAEHLEHRNGRGPDVEEDELTPELRRAVAALRQLPRTSPDAVARVTAAVAIANAGRQGRVRRWAAGGLAAAAAAAMVLVATRDRGAAPPVAVPASAGGVASASPVVRGAIRAVGNGAEPDAADPAFSDAPRPVTFMLRRPGARAVALVGDFNRWDMRAAPLARGADGVWVTTVPLAPGRHAYRFVVDDSLRVLDPRAPAERDAELGVAHSVVVVGAP